MVTWKHLLINTNYFGCARKENSPFTIIGVPLDNSETYKPGTRFAPGEIRTASCNIEFYSIYSSLDIDSIGFNDIGDIVVVPGDNNESLERIKTVIKGFVSEHRSLPIILGGEHTLTFATYSAFKEILKDDIGIIVFDAHLDLRTDYMGYRLSHASVFRRLYEEYQPPIFYIGARALTQEEIEYAKLNNISYKTRIQPLQETIYDLDKFLNGKKYIYISIDMDVIDPAYAPGVSNPEPLGLLPRDVIYYLKKIIEKSNPIAIDIVEVNPLVDINSITSILASKIIVEIAGLYLSTKGFIK